MGFLRNVEVSLHFEMLRNFLSGYHLLRKVKCYCVDILFVDSDTLRSLTSQIYA